MQKNISNKKRVIIVSAENIEVIEVVKAVIDRADFTLIGDKNIIEKCFTDLSFNINRVQIINESDHHKAAKIGAKMVSVGDGDIIMKGLIHTGSFIKSLLVKDLNLLKRKGSLISLVSRFKLPGYHKPLFITDPGINIAPNIDQKAEIIKNAIDVAHSLGVKEPKVACIAPVEVVNPSILSSVEAEKLAKEYSFENAIVEGPVSFDLALSSEAARIKGFNTKVAGDADILLFPNIDAGNPLYKSLTIFGHGEVSGIVSGLKVPVVLTSRADSIESKIKSLELAIEVTL